MNTLAELLDLAKSRAGLSSDYQLAKHLGVYASAVGNYRAGRSYPDDAIAEKLADLAGYDRGYIVVLVHALRAGESEGTGVWSYILGRLRTGGPVVLPTIIAALLGAWSGGPDGGAMASTSPLEPSSISTASKPPSVHIMFTSVQVQGVGRRSRRRGH